MTEDMIQDREDMFENLGSSSDAAKIRTELQSVQLQSGMWNLYFRAGFGSMQRSPTDLIQFAIFLDMEAFKAANPGCVIGDFVRWHSPKDWDEGHGRMSTRMQDAGNFWQELWAVSFFVPCISYIHIPVDILLYSYSSRHIPIFIFLETHGNLLLLTHLHRSRHRNQNPSLHIAKSHYLTIAKKPKKC